VPLTLYLDTSVVSALRDDRTPERQTMSQEFWNRLNEFAVFTSTVLTDEITLTPDADRRRELLELVSRVRVVGLTTEIGELAGRYVAFGVFGPADMNDSIHVAAAVLGGADILVSWNFRHLVNRRRRGLINSINAQLGHRSIEILSPPEV